MSLFCKSFTFSSAFEDMNVSLLVFLDGTKRSTRTLLGFETAGYFFYVGSHSLYYFRRSELAALGKFSYSIARNLDSSEFSGASLFLRKFSFEALK